MIVIHNTNLDGDWCSTCPQILETVIDQGGEHPRGRSMTVRGRGGRLS